MPKLKNLSIFSLLLLIYISIQWVVTPSSALSLVSGDHLLAEEAFLDCSSESNYYMLFSGNNLWDGSGCMEPPLLNGSTFGDWYFNNFVGITLPINAFMFEFSSETACNTVAACQAEGNLIGSSTFNLVEILSNPTPTPNPVSSAPRTGTINVVKTVINDNGRTKTIADFPLFVSGRRVISGVTNNFTAPGPILTITETRDPNYIQSFSGDCDSNGQMNLNPGENKFCIVTNDDIGAPVVVPPPPIPPLINVVKVPSPLALPDGSGPVLYTYTLRNIGTVPVTDITMVGDTCSPIVLASGDTNSDAKLDVNETWVHHCSINLTETHTNTVVATGWANGISAVDIATATVIVNVPIIPPLINVIIRPSMAVTVPSEIIEYTYTLANPGKVPLDNVSLTDDKCAPISGRTGDINNDNKLDVSETWTYTCSSSAEANLVHTVRARGSANGITIADISLATIVVIPRELFDIKLSIEDPLLDRAGDLVARIQFTSFGLASTLAKLDYRIEDANSKTVFVENDEITVETERLVTKEFSGLILESGKYTLFLKTTYGNNVQDEFRQDFEVKETFISKYRLEILALIITLISVMGGFIIYHMIKIRQRNKTNFN